jgi:hypothetical protein
MPRVFSVPSWDGELENKSSEPHVNTLKNPKELLRTADNAHRGLFLDERVDARQVAA